MEIRLEELSDQQRQRLLKLERIRQHGIDPYPACVHRTHTAAEARKAFEADESFGQEKVTLAAPLPPDLKAVLTRLREGK